MSRTRRSAQRCDADPGPYKGLNPPFADGCVLRGPGSAVRHEECRIAPGTRRLLCSDEEIPRIVVAKDHNALVIVALDEAAARLGLDVGLPLANARAICPNVEVHDADPDADRTTLEAIADWCDRFTPLVALDAPHGLFLDITGCAHLFGGEAALLQQLCQGIARQGFVVQAAIAGTPAAARTLARGRPDTIVPKGCEAAAVAPLPVALLGAEESITRALRRAGLKTIGDVAVRASSEISARFGAAFVDLLHQALGLHGAPISPRKPAPDYVVEKRFTEPVATADVIAQTLTQLAQMLIATMERNGKGARCVEARFFRSDGAVRSIAVETGQAVSDAAVLDRLFNEKLDALADPLDPGFGFDLIRLSANATADVTPTQQGFDSHAQEAEDVGRLIDRLAARLGARRVTRYMPIDTHIPERADLAVPAHQIVTLQEAWPTRTAGEPPLRPLRLFDPPEPVKVMALFPDGPPAQFEWRRVQHRLERVEGPERIAMEWWRLAYGIGFSGQSHTRDYFRAENKEGCRFWLFRRGIYMREVRGFDWFLHGIFA